MSFCRTCKDASAILTNKLFKYNLKNIAQAICVSHTSRENTALRARLPPHRISVIPNAVDTNVFVPTEMPARFRRACTVTDTNRLEEGRITIVVMSRLVLRKGVDLLVHLIPAICKAYPHVNFIVGGDGPKRVELEQVREQEELMDRVTMLGCVPHHLVSINQFIHPPTHTHTHIHTSARSNCKTRAQAHA